MLDNSIGWRVCLARFFKQFQQAIYMIITYKVEKGFIIVWNDYTAIGISNFLIGKNYLLWSLDTMVTIKIIYYNHCWEEKEKILKVH